MPKVPVTIELDAQAPRSDRVSARILVRPSNARASKVHVLLAGADDGLVSDVSRGENADRKLSHLAVVRSLKRVAQMDAAKGLVTTETLQLDPAWRYAARNGPSAGWRRRRVASRRPDLTSSAP